MSKNLSGRRSGEGTRCREQQEGEGIEVCQTAQETNEAWED